ncbi:hypothetical protein D8B26_007646 [Coccidioides posadasii str. Silveira]|uniref:uncharacterized protein n=1 Tax=Coccidioides posadasii (strain RMSCC 757 / Silveira) TaxID=443226 RepID=UPI001BEE026F|nr:hypothetical protein D8B26_007646 [Coccidioides posadasii str. Silveira]
MQSAYIPAVTGVSRSNRAAQAPEATQRTKSVGGPCRAETARTAPPDPSSAVSATSVEANTLQGADTGPATLAAETGDGVRNPLLDERPWFFPLTSEMPILVGEATDVAFATRFRQELLGNSQSHFLRTQNVHDETICSQWNSEYPWSTPSRARFLLKVSLSTYCMPTLLPRAEELYSSTSGTGNS